MFNSFKKQKKTLIYSPEDVGKIVLEAYKKAKDASKFESKLLVATGENQYKVSIKVASSFVFEPILVEKYLESVIFPTSHYEIFVSSYQINIMKKLK